MLSLTEGVAFGPIAFAEIDWEFPGLTMAPDAVVLFIIPEPGTAILGGFAAILRLVPNGDVLVGGFTEDDIEDCIAMLLGLEAKAIFSSSSKNPDIDSNPRISMSTYSSPRRWGPGLLLRAP